MVYTFLALGVMTQHREGNGLELYLYDCSIVTVQHKLKGSPVVDAVPRLHPLVMIHTQESCY